MGDSIDWIFPVTVRSVITEPPTSFPVFPSSPAESTAGKTIWNGIRVQSGSQSKPAGLQTPPEILSTINTISLTLQDISFLIDLLGHAGSKDDAKLLRDHLKKNVPAIVKLLACATGVAPAPILDDDDDE